MDSSVARELPREQRELHLQYPLELTPTSDPLAVRKLITTAQKPVARLCPDAMPGGGNDQKTICITFT